MQRNTFFRLSVLFLLYISTAQVIAQDKTSQNWWTGDTSQGIQFSQPGDTARLVSRGGTIPGFGLNGSAVASDPVSGALMFYTDGVNVYDATHRVMPDGGGLTGDPTYPNPAVICRVPGQTTQYYVITNSGGATPQVSFTIVDMSLPGGTTIGAPPLGNVVAASKSQPITGLTNQSGAMIIVKDTTTIPPSTIPTDYWLITQTAGSPTFNVTAITASGFGTPVAYTFNSAPGIMGNFSASQFAYNEPQGKLAVAPSEINRNIAILTFDPDNGALTFDRFITNSAVTNAAAAEPAIYDVEWSDDQGTFLYASQYGNGVSAELLQYDLSIASPLADTINVIGMEESYGLQMGPDSLIYHLYQKTAGGPIFAGRINDPDTIAQFVNYEDSLLNNAQFTARQFPSFLVAHPVVPTVVITSSGTCANTPISFSAEVTPPADSLRWDFGDGTGQVFATNPLHTYTTGNQTFTVTLVPFVNGDSIPPTTYDINITEFTLQLSLVSDTIACSCELEYPQNPPDPDRDNDRYNSGEGSVCPDFALEVTPSDDAAVGTTRWFGPSGELGISGLTLTPVDSAGFYYVTVEDAGGSGCIAYAGVNIQEYGVQDQRANIWHFGNNAGIDFNIYTPTDAINPIEGPTTAPEGVATISDQNGQVLFSTDGDQVWDRNGNALLSGTMLGGSNDATQSSFIIPFPGDPTLYYIFTTQKVYPDLLSSNQYELRYAIFDLKLPANGNLVDMDPAPGFTPSKVLFTKSTERITGNQGWLIAHEYGNNNFRAYPITGNGIGTPVISSIGSDHSFQYAEHAQGYMKLTGGNIVVALSTPGVSNIVEIFDFDNTTGAVTDPRSVTLSQTTGQVYGVDIQGNRLLATTRFAAGVGPSMLHEFVLDSTTFDYEPIGTPIAATGELGAIERGPDGQIYVAVNGSGSLGTINVAGDRDTPSTFTENGFALSPTDPPGTSTPTSTLGLPNFIQSIGQAPMSPSISFNSQCEDTNITFNGTGTSIIDTLIWDFGDGERMEGANLNTVQHAYDDPGTYLVKLTIKNRCAGFVDSLNREITIYPNPNGLSGTVAICDGTEFMVATADPQTGESYFWSNGDTTLTSIPTRGGIFSVALLSAQGCADTTTWLVTDIRPEIELGPNRSICQNAPGPSYDFSSEGDTWNWTVNGAPASTSAAFTVPTGTLGLTEYKLTASDTRTGCTITDSLTVDVQDSPEWTETVLPADCGSPTGQIQIDITSDPSIPYSYSAVRNPDYSESGAVTSSPIILSALEAGAYAINITNQITGCPASLTVAVNDGTFDALLDKSDPCLNDNGRMLATVSTANPAQSPYTYQIFENGNPVAFTNGTHTTAQPIELPEGNYVVEITSGPCVNSSIVVPLIAGDSIEIADYDINACVAPFTIEVLLASPPPSVTYAWTGPIIGPTNTAEIEVSAGPAQQFTLKVTDNDGNLCPARDQLTVPIGSHPPADVTQTSACEDIVFLVASPDADFFYEWRNKTAGEAFQGAGSTISADPSEDGDEFVVRITNLLTNCASRDSLIVSVIGEITVNIEVPDQICQGTPFTLIAATGREDLGFEWSIDTTAPFATADAETYEDGNTIDSTLVINDNTDGLVFVEVTSGDPACRAEATANIVVSPTTPGLLPETAIICPGAPEDHPRRQRLLDPGAGFDSYLWYFEDDSDPIGTTQTIQGREPGTYRVELINRFNCPSEDEITLTVECDPIISGPNAFRPGGLNKEFFLFAEFIDEASFEMFIFNRWGEMVHQSTGLDPAGDISISKKWNGGYKNDPNQPLPPGTYTYLVKYKSTDRPELGTLEYRGGVVLLR